jgi:hypothetical protein
MRTSILLAVLLSAACEKKMPPETWRWNSMLCERP